MQKIIDLKVFLLLLKLFKNSTQIYEMASKFVVIGDTSSRLRIPIKVRKVIEVKIKALIM